MAHEPDAQAVERRANAAVEGAIRTLSRFTPSGFEKYCTELDHRLETNPLFNWSPKLGIRKSYFALAAATLGTLVVVFWMGLEVAGNLMGLLPLYASFKAIKVGVICPITLASQFHLSTQSPAKDDDTQYLTCNA